MKTASSKIKQGPGDPEWETWTTERVRNLVDEHFPTLSTQQAFLIQVRDEIFRTGRLDREEHCISVIKRMNLPMKPELRNALDVGWQSSPYQPCDAYEKQILDEALGSGLCDITSIQTLKGILMRLGEQYGWALNSEGVRQMQERQAAERRKRLIQTIAAGRSTYPLFVKAHGQVRYFEVALLENETDETLESLALTVPQLRSQIAGRNSVKRAQPQVEEGISLTAPAQKHAVQVVDDEFLAHPQHPEREYTASEIKRLSSEAYRRLVFSGSQSRGAARRAAITRILSGRNFGE
jgi:hypothetical protein